MKKIRYVAGEITDDLDLEEDERIFFAGDCVSYKGKINGEMVDIKKFYKTTHQVDESNTRPYDMVKRVAGALFKLIKYRKKRYLRARGCPVSVSDHIHYLSALGGFKNINFDKQFFLPIALAYLQMRLHRFLNAIR
jgi:hypothetical protein